MKPIHTLLSALGLAAALATSAPAATPEQEKAFVDAYKKAAEAGDAKALNAFLLIDGATEETVEFFKMMQEIPAGAKITSIELVTPSKEEAEKMSKPMTMPDGKTYTMPVTPTKQLVLVIEEKSENSSGTQTSRCPVAEKDGKFVIPVPVPAKADAKPATKPATKEGKAKPAPKK